jgi:hypothetical protein
MTYSGDMNERPAVSSWAVGGLAFAATLMILNGAFSTIAGLAALIDGEYFAEVRGYAFDLDITAWAWIHLLLGLGVLAVGFGLFANAAWAGTVTIALAVLTAIDYFLFMPFAPFWSSLVIALNVWIIWAVTRTHATVA